MLPWACAALRACSLALCFVPFPAKPPDSHAQLALFLTPSAWEPTESAVWGQSIPVYCTEDQNQRLRSLKYTPDHMHCQAFIWGPLVTPNTGLIAVQSLAQNQAVRQLIPLFF